MICVGSLIASELTLPTIPNPVSVSPNTGVVGAGTSVTITGTNFLGTTAVKMASTNFVSFTVVSDTTITGVVPSGSAGVKNLSVTNASGTGTLVNAYTYTSASVPTLASLNYALADIAGGGQSIVATGTNCSGVTAVNIWGTTVTPSATTATTVTFTAPAHAAGTTTVSLTSPGGTSGTLAFESWSPSQITGSPLWFDAERGVTQVANAVSGWTEQKAGGVNAAQATAGNKPTWTANVFGTLHSLRFARASTSYMQVSPQTVASTGSVTWRAVVKTTDATATSTGTPGVDPANTIIGCSAGGGSVNGGIGGDGTAGTVNMRAYDGATWQPASGSSAVNNGSPHIIGGNVNGTSKVIQCVKDGANVGSAGTLGVGGFVTAGWDTIGAGFSLTDPLGGDLGFFLYMPSAISGGDDTKLTAWSRQRWGTP